MPPLQMVLPRLYTFHPGAPPQGPHPDRPGGAPRHIMDYKGIRVVYKKYASLWFIVGVEKEENALLVMDIMHRFVEALDRYFGNVSGDI